jgi:peptidyl-dipeptidase A
MKNELFRVFMMSAVMTTVFGCGGAIDEGMEVTEPVSDVSSETAKEGKVSIQQSVDEFLAKYFEEYAAAELAQTMGYWKAANSGKKEDFEAFAKADLALKTLHSDTEKYSHLNEMLTHQDELSPQTKRSLEVAQLSFKENQLPEDMLAQMVALSTEIEQLFSTFRGELDGEKFSNNQLLERLAKEKKSVKREAAWGALKQVGEAVGAKLVELARLRNEAAKRLGYANFWDMRVRLQEHDPEQIMAIFSELEKVTDEPFKNMKKKLDGELAKRFKIKADKMMPWHYDNPFFQSAPPSAKVNLDDFYKDKPKEEIAALAVKFYGDIGLPAQDIVANSDLYEREGKDQHAFCIAMDRKGDVRTLLNVKPTADSMNTMLHEEGHAVYYKFLDYNLPYNQREAAHILTTEGIAMLFGALAENPTWLVDYAGADPKVVEKQRAAILEQRQREQLIFARWTMVMLFFEKDLYENPDQDLNKLWWDYVERFQMIKRPEGRDAADWASKPHFTIAPVYYHNYMLGELYAAQLRSALAKMANHTGANSSLSFTGRKDFGEYLINKVFKPGMTVLWPQFVKDSTGEELSCKHFAAEVE